MKLKTVVRGTGMVSGLVLLIIMISGQAIAQEDTPPAPPMEEVNVEGRLKLESRGEEEWLVLHGKDAQTYHILGSLTQELTGLLEDLGIHNLVSVEGLKGAFPSTINCEHSYKFNEDGTKTMKTECIPYYDLDVKKIIASKVSAEEMPPPETDKKEEARIRRSALSQMEKEGLIKLGSIKGKISSLNVRSPIMTVEITYSDKDGNPVKKVLLLTSNTIIAKKTFEDEEPLYISETSLRVGQEVNVEYSTDEMTTEALFITVLRD